MAASRCVTARRSLIGAARQRATLSRCAPSGSCNWTRPGRANDRLLLETARSTGTSSGFCALWREFTHRDQRNPSVFGEQYGGKRVDDILIHCVQARWTPTAAVAASAATCRFTMAWWAAKRHSCTFIPRQPGKAIMREVCSSEDYSVSRRFADIR